MYEFHVLRLLCSWKSAKNISFACRESDKSKMMTFPEDVLYVKSQCEDGLSPDMVNKSFAVSLGGTWEEMTQRRRAT